MPSPSVLTDSFLASVPHFPGVYMMYGKSDVVLYVGKARDLRKRLSSYKRADGSAHSKTIALLAHTRKIETIVTGTEKEALILEASLIKKHRPRYNVILRDDKNYPYIKVTLHERWPRVVVTRRRAKDGSRYFGPYSSASAMNETLRLVKKVFPLRNCKGTELTARQRPCLNYQIGRCLAPCSGLADRDEYLNNVERVITTLSGHRKELGRWLEEEMKNASGRQDFEKAALYRDRLQALAKTLEKQVVSAAHFKDQDIIALARQGPSVAVSFLFIREGAINGHLSYFIAEPLGDDGQILAEAMEQFYGDDRLIPPEIIVSDRIDDHELLEEWLLDLKGSRVGIKVPQRGILVNLVNMARGNASQVFADREKRERSNEALLRSVEKNLQMKVAPRQIECLDISNIGGKQAVGSLVCFTNGEPDKKNYRHYRIANDDTPDDYRMIREVLNRRLDKKNERSLPDLLIIDGGKGQLNVALDVLKDHGLIDQVALASIAKDKNDKGERIFTPGRKNPLDLKAGNPVLLFFMKIRDESHRFGITFHRKLRSKGSIRSLLDDIPGVGPSRKKTLLKHFGSLKRVKEATVAELTAVEGVGPELALTIFNNLHSTF
ncbi:MAG: excinuclease ABC subunit UvrC [Proteobacteria bacterium]|nr:excinuclease ABC subunit UvrC [Pseudomonadota bacterium]MBU1739378.1 excinuclease ABC subunit UvrC [Pseudomonadota bacterium]